MKVYIAGPIAGYTDGNRDMFKRAAVLLEGMGHTPLNPHDITGDHVTGPCIGGPSSIEGERDHEYGCYLRADIVAMMFCDAITLLPGWQNSKGAATEAHVAQSIGLPEVELPELYE